MSGAMRERFGLINKIKCIDSGSIMLLIRGPLCVPFIVDRNRFCPLCCGHASSTFYVWVTFGHVVLMIQRQNELIYNPSKTFAFL